jgi:LysM repeat protein
MSNRTQFIWSFVFITILTTSFSFASSLSAKDSVGVQRIGDQSFILHQVEPKETLFGISRKYQSPVSEIVNANPLLKQGLKIGQTIKVPFISKSELPKGAVLHNVAPGETLFSISKKYGVDVQGVMKTNELKGNDLSVGQSLIITPATPAAETPKAAPMEAAISTARVAATKSAPNKAESRAGKEKVDNKKAKEESKIEQAKAENAPAPKISSNSAPLVPGQWRSHTVSVGETLFSIASQYNSRVEDIITWNALTSNNLQQGQTLKVGRGEAEESKVPIVGDPKVVSSVDEMMVTPTEENTSGGFKNIKENGQAELIEGTGGHKKYLVLHRTAPVGTIMRVKNEENDVTIFARVVGTLPQTGDNSKLVIKLSQAAFDQLKAVNGRFPVEIMY